jgi:serine protease Do
MHHMAGIVPNRGGLCLLVVGIANCLATFCGPANAQETHGLAAAVALENAFVKVIEQAETSVVSIARIKLESPMLLDHKPLNPFGLDFRNTLESSQPSSPDFIPNDFGAGIIIAPHQDQTERFILTNYHVVRGGPPVGQKPSEYRIYVRFANRRGYYAKILAADPRGDLAVLRIDFAALGLKPADLKPIKLGNASNLKKGRFVIALGNPYAIARDGSASASWGIISNISRRPKPAGPPRDPETSRKETIHHYGTLLQIDTRLNLGTSGGPLLNLRGELIGITTSLAALDGFEKSVGYATPLDDPTRRAIDALTRGHEVEYGFLGVEPRNVPYVKLRQMSGGFRQSSAAKVAKVFRNSPASFGGLQPGDLILEVNEKPIHNKEDLIRTIGRLAPESIAHLRVWRNRQALKLAVKLGKWPVHDEEGIIATSPRYPAWRGIRVDFPTGRRKYLPYPNLYHQAVLVTGIATNSSAGSTQLQEGDFISHVNQVAVRTPREFRRAVQGQTGDVQLRLIDRSQPIVLRR